MQRRQIQNKYHGFIFLHTLGRELRMRRAGTCSILKELSSETTALPSFRVSSPMSLARMSAIPLGLTDILKITTDGVAMLSPG